MRLTLWLLAALAVFLCWLLAVTADATADHCAAPAVRAYAVQKVQAHHHAAPLVQRYYYVPYPDDDGLEREAERLRLRVDVLQLRREVQALTQALQAPAGEEPELLPPAAVTAGAWGSCSACHAADTAEKGGGKALFGADGAPLRLTARQLERLAERVLRGEMPPPASAKLSEVGKAAVVCDFLEAAK